MFAFWKIVILCTTMAPLLCAARALCTPVSDMLHPASMSAGDWQRVFDPTHPAAPPRLLIKQTDNARSTSHGKPRQAVACVRAGDPLVLHQAEGAPAALSLAARALESGTCGAHIRARIAVTGAVAGITVAEQGIGILSGKKDTWR